MKIPNTEYRILNKKTAHSEFSIQNSVFFAFLAQVRIDEVFKFQGDVVKNITEFQTINAYVSAIVPNVYVVAGIFLFGLILFGGFQYITGAGDEEKLKKGKAVLTSALLGFAILFGSFWIIKIIQVLTGVPILNPSI